MSKNFYIMQRGWMNNEAFSDEPYTEREAFMYLVENAAWKARVYRVGSKAFKLKRGQLTASLRYLGEAWKWNKNKVARFLDILAFGDMIGTEVRTGQTIITICNYNKYQDVGQFSGTDLGQEPGQSRDTGGTAAGQWRDKTNQDNQYNQDNHVIGIETEYEYLEWIKLYPKKGNDYEAREAFLIARKEIEFEELKTKTVAYADAVKGSKPKFISSPENWLKKRKWNAPLPEPEEQEFDITAYFEKMEGKTEDVDR